MVVTNNNNVLTLNGNVEKADVSHQKSDPVLTPNQRLGLSDLVVYLDSASIKLVVTNIQNSLENQGSTCRSCISKRSLDIVPV